jgi:hypothetical protein
MSPFCRCRAVVAILLGAAALAAGRPDRQPAPQHPSFGSSVDVVVVNVTVTDGEGRFVPGLRQRDFEVLEDGRPQPISAFSAERVPVSIGIAIDLSNSMRGEKFRSARSALDRLLSELLDPEDEAFLYSFSDEPILLQGWTTRRDLLRKALDRMSVGGLTALYDTTVKAIDLAATGRHRKKALVIVSDGADTASHTDIAALKQQIRESDVLVYAIGIDTRGKPADPARRGTEGSDPWTGGWPGQRPPPVGPRPTPPPPPRAPIPKDGWNPGSGEVDAQALRATAAAAPPSCGRRATSSRRPRGSRTNLVSSTSWATRVWRPRTGSGTRSR